jgi:hypothetical protein
MPSLIQMLEDDAKIRFNDIWTLIQCFFKAAERDYRIHRSAVGDKDGADDQDAAGRRKRSRTSPTDTNETQKQTRG